MQYENETTERLRAQKAALLDELVASEVAFFLRGMQAGGLSEKAAVLVQFNEMACRRGRDYCNAGTMVDTVVQRLTTSAALNPAGAFLARLLGCKEADLVFHPTEQRNSCQPGLENSLRELQENSSAMNVALERMYPEKASILRQVLVLRDQIYQGVCHAVMAELDTEQGRKALIQELASHIVKQPLRAVESCQSAAEKAEALERLWLCFPKAVNDSQCDRDAGPDLALLRRSIHLLASLLAGEHKPCIWRDPDKPSRLRTAAWVSIRRALQARLEEKKEAIKLLSHTREQAALP